jgi:arylsulfatase A-like enzyme
MHRRRKHWRIVLLLALPVIACHAGPNRTDPGRDVILVVIDTLRADFVGISGQAPHDATPNLDRLARRGRWCTNAWSNAPWTPPSIMSIMTSLEPPVHGIELPGDELAETIPGTPDNATFLASLLRNEGYRTVAVTAGGGVGRRYGFDRGFDEWYEPDHTPKTDVEDGVNRAILHLRQPDQQPLFLFFHTYEVHLPNTHPPFPSETDDASMARAAYAGDLVVADHHLGRLIDELEASGRLDRTLLVITSDHGENLHDRDLGSRPVDHGHHLFAELLRVPLLVVAPGLIPATGAFDPPVQSLDILPTIASLLGVEVDETTIQGRDLRPHLQGWRPPPPPPQLFAWAPLQGPTWSAVRTQRWTHITAPPVQTDQWWGQVQVPPMSLHDRANDGDERIDLSSIRSGKAAGLAAQQEDRRSANLDLRRRLGGSDALTVDESDALRALGYIDR